MNSHPRTIYIVVPSMRISGGNIEIARLASDLAGDPRLNVVILSMWKPEHEVPLGGIPITHLLGKAPDVRAALGELPQIARAFVKALRRERTKGRPPVLLLTHFSTFSLAWLRPAMQRVCFNQDMEWLFVRPGCRREALKRLLLGTSRRSIVVTTNHFVTESYRDLGVKPLCEVSIWADPNWLASSLSKERDIDVLMLVRGSEVKRLDLYLAFMDLFRQTPWRIAAITPDTSLAGTLEGKVHEVHLRPSNEEMKVLYGRSRVFLLLSDVEGFGLPPLEAMGSGCIPICRDSGGVRCYMQGEFADLLIAPEVPIQEIVSFVEERLRTNWLPEPETARSRFREGQKESLKIRETSITILQERLLQG